MTIQGKIRLKLYGNTLRDWEIVHQIYDITIIAVINKHRVMFVERNFECVLHRVDGKILSGCFWSSKFGKAKSLKNTLTK